MYFSCSFFVKLSNVQVVFLCGKLESTSKILKDLVQTDRKWEVGPSVSIREEWKGASLRWRVFLIGRVLHICGKLLHQTLPAPVRQTKGKPDASQTGEWRGRARGRKPTRGSGAKGKRRERERERKREEGEKSQGVFCTYIPSGEAVWVGPGLIHVRVDMLFPSEGEQKADKIQVEMKLVAWVDRCNTREQDRDAMTFRDIPLMLDLIISGRTCSAQYKAYMGQCMCLQIQNIVVFNFFFQNARRKIAFILHHPASSIQHISNALNAR